MKRVFTFFLAVLLSGGCMAWAAGQPVHPASAPIHMASGTVHPASSPARPTPRPVHPASAPSPTKLPSPTPGIASEDRDPGEPALPFSCPECGYANENPGICPVCHIDLVEETTDSPDTENPLEDPEDQDVGDEALPIGEASDPANTPADLRAPPPATGPVKLPRLR